MNLYLNVNIDEGWMWPCVSPYTMDLHLHSVLVFDDITKPLDATCVWSVPPPVIGRRYNSGLSWPHSPHWGENTGVCPAFCGTKLYSKIPTLVAFKTISMRGWSPPRFSKHVYALLVWDCDVVCDRMWLINGEHRFGSKCCPCVQGRHGIWSKHITLKPAQNPPLYCPCTCNLF